jgi:hypothetical protein
MAEFCSKYDIIFHIAAHVAIFIQNCGPRRHFPSKCGPWMDGFEFETPALIWFFVVFLNFLVITNFSWLILELWIHTVNVAKKHFILHETTKAKLTFTYPCALLGGRMYWNMCFECLIQWFPMSAPRTTGGPLIPVKINILCFAEH